MRRHPTSFIVYVAVSRATGKAYVGCTSKTLRERQEEHHTAAVNGSPYKFHKALRELGLSSFSWSVLDTVTSSAAMFERERFHVARYNSYKAGYNSTPGGVGSAADGRATRMKLPKRPRYQPSPRRLLARG